MICVYKTYYFFFVLFKTSDYKMVPDIGMLSSRVRTCLQLQESLNNTGHLLFSADNINSLIDTKLCSLNTSMLSDTLKAYQTLNVPHNQLQLIPPTFNDTLPFLQFAVSIKCLVINITLIVCFIISIT